MNDDVDYVEVDGDYHVTLDDAETVIVTDKLEPIRNDSVGPFLVIAANGQSAKGWARERGLRASQWRYVSGPDRLARMRGFHVVLVDGWETRSDSAAIEAALQTALDAGSLTKAM